MSCGKITVETLELAKQDLRIFLTNNRKLAPSDYTVRCLNVWEDPRVSNWIDQNREKFTLLSFAEFFIVVRDRVLEPDWQDSTFRKMRAVRMPEDLKTSVSDLAVQLLVLNNLLQGTPRFQSEDNLKIMLIDAVDSNLRESYNKEVEDHSANVSHGIHSKDFHTFTKAFQVLDNSRHRQLLLARQMAEHMIRSHPNSRPNTPAATSSTANAQARRNTTVASGGNYPVRLPQLTANERRLLSENDGCFKCRSFSVKCRISSTEHEFLMPTGNGYKELTITDVEAAHALHGPISEPVKKTCTNPIAAVGLNDDSELAVASIMPNAVLGDGTDSEEEVSGPFRVPHLRWKCHVTGPKSDFPILVNSFIDNGAHLALIHPDLAHRLGLTRHKLTHPEPVCAAFQSNNQPAVPALTEFVRLKVGSIDGCFTSRSVPFIIAPGLCTQLLLGLPWLTHNNIVIDYAKRSCIHKPSGFDLLHPPVVNCTVPFKLKSIENIHDSLQNIVASIRQRIENLAYIDTLRAHKDTLKKKYSAIFEPIPHVDDLPSSVTAKIQLIDASKSISSRSYRCPRKFRAAWQ
ncbi:hypothetical protein C8R41DRAFT_761517, partial [Lentinula lateritia]